MKERGKRKKERMGPFDAGAERCGECGEEQAECGETLRVWLAPERQRKPFTRCPGPLYECSWGFECAEADKAARTASAVSCLHTELGRWLLLVLVIYRRNSLASRSSQIAFRLAVNNTARLCVNAAVVSVFFIPPT